MQLNLAQLPQHLNGPLRPVYLIAGETPLLCLETRDAIRQASLRAGYQHTERLDVDSSFRWEQLHHLSHTYNLFADQTLIELHNPAAKFDTEAGKILLQYCESPPPDKILLIVTGKLSGPQQKTRWFTRILDLGIVITIWPVKSSELPQWIHARLRQANIKASPAAIRMLAELTEGNLLATQQTITKLGLLYPEQFIDVNEMAAVINDNAQFNIFELSQYMLQGDARSVLRVLNHLRATDTEPTLVLWLLAKECRELLKMTAQLQQGKNIQAVLAAQWSTLKAFYQSALRRVDRQQLQQILLACQRADQTIKGLCPGNVWDLLTGISLDLAGKPCC